MMHINDLSENVLGVVFDKIDTHSLAICMITCKRFYNIIQESIDLSLRIYSYYFG